MSNLATASSHDVRSSILSEAPQPVRDLINLASISGSNVPGSSAYLSKMRRMTRGLRDYYGPWTMFVTLNPSELNAHLFMKIAGKEYTFDALTGAPVGRPSSTECWRTVAANPAACAEFFHAYHRAFLEVALGWDLERQCQVKPHCLFGTVEAWSYNTETSRRQCQHAHWLVSARDRDSTSLGAVARAPPSCKPLGSNTLMGFGRVHHPGMVASGGSDLPTMFVAMPRYSLTSCAPPADPAADLGRRQCCRKDVRSQVWKCVMPAARRLRGTRGVCEHA